MSFLRRGSMAKKLKFNSPAWRKKFMKKGKRKNGPAEAEEYSNTNKEVRTKL